MTVGSPRPLEAKLPTLCELGDDLLGVTAFRRLLTQGAPVAWIAGYFLFAHEHRWVAAVGCVMGLSFMSYGSTSHDLVHHTLGLPSRLNNLLLTLIELLSFRSGTAYRLSHLHHHRHLLDCEDIEGIAAHGSLASAILSGPGMQLRLWRWAWRTHRANRPALFGEAVAIASLAIAAIAVLRFNWTPFIYAVLVVAGSWTFPLITVYIPHDAHGESSLARTRLFRGWLPRLIAFDHLYHLEHHLYPSVPHHHWKTLADRLDPHFERADVRPYVRHCSRPTSARGASGLAKGERVFRIL
jgi:beta-carotene hydroxylase